MMNDNIQREVITLPPFKRFCMTIGELPSSYVETMTYYEMVLWFTKYLGETIIPTVNNNAEAVTELQNLFVELQTYVNNYFDNLDVQEEINNKLDEMAEDGTLEQIVANYLSLSVCDNLNFRLDNSLLLNQTNEYQDKSFTQLQGFCYVNGNIIMALRDDTNTSNYVKLVEYNPSTRQIIRSNYLTLYHANSIAYNERDNKLYVSATSMVVDNVPNQVNNDILVLDYNSFNTLNTISVDNLPVNHRIRSVSYDNDTNTLYGGDITTLFVIDETNETITETIELETTGIDLIPTNQTLKKIGDWYVGVWVTYIAFWNLDKKLIKVVNLKRDYGYEKVGEVEDCYIFENGDITIGTMNQPQTFVKQRKINFFKSNVYTNTNDTFVQTLTGNTLVLYVDNTGVNQYENGSRTYPYHNLQTALNVAYTSKQACNIHVLGTSYDFIEVIGTTEINLIIDSNVTIDGINIIDSNVFVNYSNNNKLTLNGIREIRSKLSIYSNAENKLILNQINNTNISTGNGRNKCIYIVNSDLYIENSSVVGNDNDDLIYSIASNLKINGCDFNNYEGQYAINLLNNSKCELYNNTFTETSSNSQHHIRVTDGSILNTQRNLNKYTDYLLSYNGKVYGNLNKKTLANEVYYGDIETIDPEYSYIRLGIKVGGVRSNYQYLDISTSDTEATIYPTIWDNGINNKTNLLIFKIENGVLKIKEHYYCQTAQDSKSRETITETPATVTNYSSVASIEYHN